MNFNVPQFIDVKDKIAFQLTAAQLGIFTLGGIACFASWAFFHGPTMVTLIIIIAIVTVALAFVRPNGISLGAFLTRGTLYAFRSKVLIWEKTEKSYNKEVGEEKSDGKIHLNIFDKQQKLKKISDFADVLDKRGRDDDRTSQ